ncbi:HipA domain-containing protein [Pectobacterium polonicum]|uniref:HipA domain-containing protein n=1 Tax=Pectobacterium polonicum TaxID=2485124 RepID=A0ABV1PAE2_9GAMM|nr:HipA domain-containing protein [Pectobacterium polonicum]MDC9818759.1 HipA domain-containing protein [Pectobacterium polonicum]
MPTIQIFHNHQWYDAAELDIPTPLAGRNGLSCLGYDFDYAASWLGKNDHRSCSINLPVEMMETYRSKPWFTFLDDIIPSGASRRYWVNKLEIGHLPANEQDYVLLVHGTIAPIGNIRIKESLPSSLSTQQLQKIRFSVQDVADRNSDFIEYAQQRGAAGGGATGAGGEAPKLLLRCSDNDEIWIDPFQDDLSTQDMHYLVKFPRGPRSPVDCDILRAEYYFYHELTLLGMETINLEGMRLIEGEHYPSLWLPRFDVDYIDGRKTLHGMESIYSLLKKPAGSYLNHFTVIQRIIDTIAPPTGNHAPQRRELVIEMVKRDMLNIIFGNSDNHGRNTSLIKRPQGIWLAPIYDFAPMKADPEGIARTTQWGSPYEEGGRIDWFAIANALSSFIDPEDLIHELSTTARQLIGLKSRLIERGVPQRIIAMPVMAFDYIDEKLATWQLL